MQISKELIKKKISELKTIRDILFYLDVIEKEINDRISELYRKTRMDEIGFFLEGETGWEYDFEYREFNPEYMLQPPLTKEQQKQFVEDYGNEIKEAEDLHNLDSFIKDQKKFYEKQLVKYSLMENGGKRIESESNGVLTNYDCYNFDFNEIKKYAEKLKFNEAILYLKYVLKEFDREKRENFYLFMSEDEIEYFKENIIITDPAKMYEPADFTMVGIGAKQSMAKENFEKNIKNEIQFLEDKKNMEAERLENLNIDDPREFDKIIEDYFEYGKECYLSTWKDRSQILAFEKKMIERYGSTVSGIVKNLYEYISKRTNPIEFIGCDYEEIIKNFDSDKIKNEINRIAGYISELEKLKFFTDDPDNSDKIPEDELENYNEWECYYIEKIKYKELAEWMEILRKNRPGVTDYKYGEFYPIEFNKITEVALNEIRNYKEKLEALILNVEIKTKNIDKNKKPLKTFGRGELQEALEPIAKEFNLIVGESAKSTKVRLITKKLIEQGWDANEPSVSEALRKLGYVKGRRR